MLIRHGEQFRCSKCGGDVDPMAHNEKGESRFAFAVTQRKDGSIVDPPFLATIEVTECQVCGHHDTIVDSLNDDDETAVWGSLPKWESVN